MKTHKVQTHLWAAVKVWRGLVDEVKLYRFLDDAERTERRWRRNINGTYDEAGVVRCRLPATLLASLVGPKAESRPQKTRKGRSRRRAKGR